MALGVPIVQAGAPFFVTGEPRREYLFRFLLLPASPLLTGKLPSWALTLFQSLFLVYISSLAEQVNLPVDKITLGTVNVNTLQDYPYPKGFNTPSFSVVYLEDELESVYKFHIFWQNKIRGSSDFLGDSDGGLMFEPLGNVCCSAMYFPAKQVPLGDIGVNVPTGADKWPFVFPSEIQRSPANKGGQGIAKTTVTYTRVPDIRGWNFCANIYKDAGKTSVDK